MVVGIPDGPEESEEQAQKLTVARTSIRTREWSLKARGRERQLESIGATMKNKLDSTHIFCQAFAGFVQRRPGLSWRLMATPAFP